MDKDFLKLIENLDELVGRPEKLDDETLICECFCVSVKDIRSVCQSKVDIDLLVDHFSLGQGCQTCLKSKEFWIDKIF